MILYIFGNGFDLHHGFKTGYCNYREFLHERYKRAIESFERFEYLSTFSNCGWNNIEETLSFDYDSCMINALDFYPDLNDESESRWSNLDDEIKNQTEFIFNFTGIYFLEWISKIDFSNPKDIIELDNTGLFITFNYTNTLENVYHINPANIFHIHGDISELINNGSSIQDQVNKIDNNSIRKHIQFGSVDNNPDSIKNELINKYRNDDFFAVSLYPGISTIVDFCKASSKHVENNFNKLRSFISDKDIDEIIIMGHSIMGVDNKYYSKILIPALENRTWTFYYHNNENYETVKEFIKKFSLSKYTLKYW